MPAFLAPKDVPYALYLSHKCGVVVMKGWWCYVHYESAPESVRKHFDQKSTFFNVLSNAWKGHMELFMERAECPLFIVARDPFHRAASMFYFCLCNSSVPASIGDEEAERTALELIRTQRWRTIQRVARVNACKPSEVTFRHFVSYLARHLSDEQILSSDNLVNDTHFMSQTPAHMRQYIKAKYPDVKFRTRVLRVEHIQRDVQQFIHPLLNEQQRALSNEYFALMQHHNRSGASNGASIVPVQANQSKHAIGRRNLITLLQKINYNRTFVRDDEKVATDDIAFHGDTALLSNYWNITAELDTVDETADVPNSKQSLADRVPPRYEELYDDAIKQLVRERYMQDFGLLNDFSSGEFKQ